MIHSFSFKGETTYKAYAKKEKKRKSALRFSDIQSTHQSIKNKCSKTQNCSSFGLNF